MIMLRLSAFAVSLVIFTTTYAQTEDLKNEGLHGPVRSARSQWIDSIPIEGGKSRQIPGRSTVHNFDRSGRLIEEIGYDESGRLSWTQKYTWDAEGTLLATQSTNEDGGVNDKMVYRYDGRKLAELKAYDGKGAIVFRETFIYDAAGKLLEEDYYQGATLGGRTLYKLDSSGQIIETAFFLADGSPAVAELGPCYGAHRVANKYNDARQLIETISYETGGRAKRATSYRYNDKGLRIAEFRKDVYSALDYLYEYEYDAHGNWIKQTIVYHSTRAAAPSLGIEPSESSHQTIQIRQITYY